MEFILTNERIFLRQVIETVLTSNLPFKETLKKIEAIQRSNGGTIQVFGKRHCFSCESFERFEIKLMAVFRNWFK